MSTASTTALRVGARVLLLNPDHRALLIHACDPDDPSHDWWELPGGGQDTGETLEQTARRELAEETGIELDRLGPCLWIRETHFHYRGTSHHRREHVYLAMTPAITPSRAPVHTENEKLGLIEHRWWTAPELARCRTKLLPPRLPELLEDICAGNIPAEPACFVT
jgi:8-oxo-dGTP pyrophosphatase MutT (NUDIX family)